MKKLDTYIQELVSTKNWKVPAIAGGLALLSLALLESVLFSLILALLKLALCLGGLFLLGYAVYLAYPALKEKYMK